MIQTYKGAEGTVALRPANPDGKGLNGFLLDWYLSEPRGVVAKPHRQVLAEFFTSMLVLSARFKFKPSVGTENYLYLNGDVWELSLIAPQEWTAERQAGFVGTCILQRDMSWTIEPSDNLKTSGSRVADAVSRYYDAFRDTLDADLTLEEILPFYVGRMPYYQRLYANALSRSIRAAVILGDQAGTRSREWLAALPRTSALLENRQS